MKYCSNCGEEIMEGADICLKCGKILNKEKEKTGRGKAVTSMILGIVAIIWSLSMLASLPNGIETLIVELSYVTELTPLAYVISYLIGFTLFSLTPAIIGLILGLKSTKMKRNGMAISGIILSSLSLLSCLYVIIRFLIAI